MSVSADYLEYMQELLAWLPGLRTRRMFGGVGFYSDGLFFALADDGTFYLKGDGLSEPVYREGGVEQFTYQAKGKTVRLNYWSVPATGRRFILSLLPISPPCVTPRMCSRAPCSSCSRN